MAGMGAAPKPRNARARRNADLAPQMELVFEAGEPPELPTQWIDDEGELREVKWSQLTLDWWDRWCRSPQARIFSESDWNSLLIAAFVADRFHKTFKVQYAAELRQREAAFGATPIDRLRLRMTWREDAERGFKASEAEQRRRAKETQDRYGSIHVVKDETA
jgi:hypothetical protein